MFGTPEPLSSLPPMRELRHWLNVRRISFFFDKGLPCVFFLVAWFSIHSSTTVVTLVLHLLLVGWTAPVSFSSCAVRKSKYFSPLLRLSGGSRLRVVPFTPSRNAKHRYGSPVGRVAVVRVTRWGDTDTGAVRPQCDHVDGPPSTPYGCPATAALTMAEYHTDVSTEFELH